MNNRRKWIAGGWIAIVLIAAGLLAMVIIHGGQKPAPSVLDLSQFTRLTPSTTSGTTPGPTESSSKPTVEPQVSLPEGQPPSADMTASSTNPPTHPEEHDNLHVVFPDRLSPDEFPYQPIPFEAKVVEFPIVLLDQHLLELAPLVIMDRTLGLQDADPMTLLRENVYRIEKPPVTPPPGPKPPKPPRPPEESPSGL